MFLVLICEASLAQATYEFQSFDYTIAYDNETIYNETYKKQYDLYIFHIECIGALIELRKSGDETPAIIIDNNYDFNHLKKVFSVADEYLIQPLYIPEIIVRIEYFRRKKLGLYSNIIRYKNFYFNLKTKQLYKEKNHIKLSPNELKLIMLFFKNQNKPIPKEIILEEIESQSDGSLRVFISKLKKIGLDIIYERSNSSYQLVV